ncbi:hypothetical protein CAEBREN_25523 [Caenorhabditis brenneri]|uniref:Uncharacterized protein n=1 Tax=Caenorhabditis brenneri TaxID=135651 RepID=G0MSN6_CAEBE|nr:hypothetical protein CAEBREN_25523 [Caenorhabditis brenneri]
MSYTTDAMCRYCPPSSVCGRESDGQLYCYLTLPLKQFLPMSPFVRFIIAICTIISVIGVIIGSLAGWIYKYPDGILAQKWSILHRLFSTVKVAGSDVAEPAPKKMTPAAAPSNGGAKITGYENEQEKKEQKDEESDEKSVNMV